MAEFRTIDEIIEKAISLIDQHELVRNPIAFNSVGSPIRITEYRDHNGFDANTTGVTLGIYPYVYNTSSLTTTSPNSALVFDPQHLGDKYKNAYERGTLNLEIKLSIMGMDRSRAVMDPKRPNVFFVRNEYERALRKWLEVIRVILLSKPLVNVAGYVKNSRVHYGAFQTTDWTGKGAIGGNGANAVLHSATLLWQLDFWPIRDAASLPYNKVEGYTEGWSYIGLRSKDGMDVFWDADRKDIMTLSGYPLRVTPSGAPVTWDSTEKRFEDPKTGTPLNASQLADPEAPAGKPWIQTGLTPVGIIKTPATDTTEAFQDNVYLDNATNQLQKASGDLVTQLPDGSALSYNPATKRLVLVPVSEWSRDMLIDFTDPARVFIAIKDSTGTRPNEYTRVE